MVTEPTTPPPNPVEPAELRPTAKPSTIITRSRYPKWWKDLSTAAISLTGAGTQVVVGGLPGYRTFVACIVITVSGDTNITFGFGVFGSSGAMNFGGTDEPRGIVINMAESPAPCGTGHFSISSNAPGINVGGFAVFYQEPEERRPV